jgi:hypothetical protein
MTTSHESSGDAEQRFREARTDRLLRDLAHAVAGLAEPSVTGFRFRGGTQDALTALMPHVLEMVAVVRALPINRDAVPLISAPDARALEAARADARFRMALRRLMPDGTSDEA